MIKKIELGLLATFVAASFVAIIFYHNWQAGQYFVTLGAVMELEEWLRRGR